MVGCAPCRLPLIFSACWLEADRFLRLRAHQMARKALEKNTGKTRGRPRKGFRRDGSGIKKSSGVERCTMDAGCRMYNIGLQIASSQHEAARRHACKRQHQYKTLQRSVTTAIQPPKHHSKWIKWLRDSVSSTEDSKTIKIARPIILSRTLFHEGSISTECEELGRLWVAFWAVGRVHTKFGEARGFSLVASNNIQAGQVVARGLVEEDYHEACYAVQNGGTMYGPAALVNAACSEVCANSIFQKEKGEWRVVTKRSVRAGEEVLVYYPSRGECACGATEWA